MSCNDENGKINEKKTRKRVKMVNTLEPGWVAPDGGWGWMVVIANGLINVFNLGLITCFGLIFRERFKELGINASQTTTLLNTNSAVASFVGLANGPLFRKFSYRQVAGVSAFACAISIIAISYMKTFYGIMFFLSFAYAAAKSVGMSASSLAVITYFNKRRRLAVGLAWACSSIGSIINPQLTTILMPIYGMSGTVLIFGGIAFNSIVCAFLLQPVAMHAKRKTICEIIESADKEEDTSNIVNGFGKSTSTESVRRRDKHVKLAEKRSSVGSQYLYYDDIDNGPVGAEIIGLESPMLPRANDGWFSKLNSSHGSLISSKIMEQEGSQSTLMNLRRKSSLTALHSENSVKNANRQSSEINDWKRKKEKQSTEQIVITKSCECTDDDKSHKNNDDDNMEYLPGKNSTVDLQEVKERKQNKLSWCSRAFHVVAVFFDLDLLKDCVFVNIMSGVSLAFFAELNTILLVPYILSEYGLRDVEVATIMSVISGVDVTTRITISFIATRLGWDNRTFFLVGMGFSILGRFGLAHQGQYGVLMTVAVFIGIGKSLIIVFSTLVIPDHVSQEKLAGATGLQLVTRGMIFLALGPIVGWIRDTSGNYTITLHFLNVFSYLVIISWILEGCCCSWKKRQLERIKGAHV